jgi:transposase
VLIVLENASMHQNAAFEDKLKALEARGRNLLFLPPYCPELNLIGILWRKLKYARLPLSVYDSFKQLTQTLESTLKQIESKYLLSFA